MLVREGQISDTLKFITSWHRGVQYVHCVMHVLGEII